MATTLLQVVNRVRRLHRFADVASFESSDNLTNAILDAIIEARTEILETMDWNFMMRNDGFLKTRGRVTSTSNIAVTNDSTSFTVSSFSGAIGDVTGNFVTRLVVTDDTNYGSTAFRVSSFSLSGTTLTGTLANNYPGTTDATATGQLVLYEYGLPTDVRTILSAKHEENPLRVELAPDNDIWDEWVPRHWETQDDTPEILIPGGVLLPTYDASGSEPDPLDRIMVWPTPQTNGAVIAYTYKRRLSPSTTTDEFEGVPDSVIQQIVNYAYGYTLFSSIGADPITGQEWMNRALIRARSVRDGVRMDHGRRRQIKSIDDIAGREDDEIFGRLPSTVG